MATSNQLQSRVVVKKEVSGGEVLLVARHIHTEVNANLQREILERFSKYSQSSSQSKGN